MSWVLDQNLIYWRGSNPKEETRYPDCQTGPSTLHYYTVLHVSSDRVPAGEHTRDSLGLRRTGHPGWPTRRIRPRNIDGTVVVTARVWSWLVRMWSSLVRDGCHHDWDRCVMTGDGYGHNWGGCGRVWYGCGSDWDGHGRARIPGQVPILFLIINPPSSNETITLYNVFIDYSGILRKM